MRILIFLSLAFTQPVIAAPCKALPVHDDLVEGRARTVLFPDGRHITVVGHLHGERQIYDIIDLVDKGKLASISDVEFATFMLGILRHNTQPFANMLFQSERKKVEEKLNQLGFHASEFFSAENGFALNDATVLNHARQDFEFLHRRVNESGPTMDLKFIGFEGARQTWISNFPWFLLAQRRVLEEFAVRQARGLNMNGKQIQDVLLSASNGSVFAYMQDPSLADKVPMIGVEDQAAGKKSLEVEPLDQMNKALKKLNDADEHYWSGKSKKEFEDFKADRTNFRFAIMISVLFAEVEDMEILSSEVLERKISIMRDNSFPWIKPELEDLFQAFRQRLQLEFARDRASAHNLAALHVSGIHFVGLNHFFDILKNLEEICASEQASPKPRP